MGVGARVEVRAGMRVGLRVEVRYRTHLGFILSRREGARRVDERAAHTKQPHRTVEKEALVPLRLLQCLTSRGLYEPRAQPKGRARRVKKDAVERARRVLNGRYTPVDGP